MPASIISLQRRLTLVGAIRAGAEKAPNAPGKRLESFRLTSPRRELLEQAAGLYGGEPKPWRSPVGDEWQLYTTAEQIPVLVMPGYSLRQSYELWEGATKRTRLCDGIDEELTGGPCLCNAEGVDQCDLYTRLVVALPELDTVLGWRLISRGANAGHELPTMMALIERVAAGQPFVPARLRLDERRGVREGQVVRFVVPIVDLGVGYLALAAPDQRPALAPPTPDVGENASGGYRPAPARQATLEQALGSVSRPPQQAPRGGRRTTPVGPEADEDALLGDQEPLPNGDEPGVGPGPSQPTAAAGLGEDAPAAPAPESYEQARQTKALTDPQRAELNVQVGQLRDAGHITTEQLWQAIASLRETDVLVLVAKLGGWDGTRLRWSPLRNNLTRAEASQLIEWLTVKEDQVGAE